MVPISDDPHRFDPGAHLLRADDSVLIVESSRWHNKRLLVKFADIDGREAAEELRGPLFVTMDDLRELEADEFWVHDLVGCSVRLPDGDEVGTVAAVVPGAAQDLLEIETSSGPQLVPVVKEIVVAIDLEHMIVTIDPPEGLIS